MAMSKYQVNELLLIFLEKSSKYLSTNGLREIVDKNSSSLLKLTDFPRKTSNWRKCYKSLPIMCTSS